jgi:3-hydroxyisobutyrate dehydrogenase-like beta-hydroxyacid dehydrogenase
LNSASPHDPELTTRIKHALKDADLAAQAARASGTELTLTDALLPRWRRAAAGHADDDLAAIYTTP